MCIVPHSSIISVLSKKSTSVRGSVAPKCSYKSYVPTKSAIPSMKWLINDCSRQHMAIIYSKLLTCKVVTCLSHSLLILTRCSFGKAFWENWADSVMSTAQVFHNENKTWDAARSRSMWKRHWRTLKSNEQVPRVHKHLYATCSESTASVFLTDALNLNWKMGKGHVMFSIYHRSGPKLVFKNSATSSALMRLLLTFSVSTNSSLKTKQTSKGTSPVSKKARHTSESRVSKWSRRVPTIILTSISSSCLTFLLISSSLYFFNRYMTVSALSLKLKCDLWEKLRWFVFSKREKGGFEKANS